MLRSDAHAVDALARGDQRARRSAATSSRPASGNGASRPRGRPPRRRPRQLVRRARRDGAAAGDDRDPVADELDLAEQVRVQQDRDAAAAQLLEELADDPPAGRVQGARRLVEQEEPRLADQRLGDPEPLLHPLRHRLDPRRARLREADQLEQVARARPRRRRTARGAGAARAARRRSPSRGSGTAPRGSRSRRAPARCRPVAAARRRVPSVGRTRPQAIFVERRLAGAVGPEEADELALADLQVDAAERLASAVALAHGAQGEGRVGHGPEGTLPPMPGLQEEAVALLGQLIRHRTVNPPGAERPAQEMLAGLLRDAGFEIDAARADRGAAEPRRAPARPRRGPGPVPAVARRHRPRHPRGLAAGPVVGRGRRRGLGSRRDRHEVADGRRGRRRHLAGTRGLASRPRRPARRRRRRRGARRRRGRDLAHRDAPRRSCAATSCSTRAAGPSCRTAASASSASASPRRASSASRSRPTASPATPPTRRNGDNALLKVAPLLQAMRDRRPGFDVTDARGALLAGLGVEVTATPAPRSSGCAASTRGSRARRADARRDARPDAWALASEKINVIPARAEIRSTAAPRRAWSDDAVLARIEEVLGGEGYRLEFFEEVVGNSSPADTPLMGAIERWIARERPGRARRPHDAPGVHRLADVPGGVPRLRGVRLLPAAPHDPAGDLARCHAADERIDARDMGYATACYRDVTKELLG